MKESPKILVLILSFGIYLSAFTNSGTIVYDMLDLNLHPITSIPTLMNITTTSLNPFAESETFLKVTTATIFFLMIMPDSQYSTGYYTLFSSFSLVEPENYQELSLTITIWCSKPDGTQILLQMQPEEYQVQVVDLSVVTQGASELLRRDFFKTKTFYNSLQCGTGNFMFLTLNVWNQVDESHHFLIKQLALYANKCHPYCELCSTVVSSNGICDTCASSFVKNADGTCTCARNPPSLGVIALNGIVNRTNFRYLCQTVKATNFLPCAKWIDPAVNQKLPFDYCTECGGSSQVAQYLTLPFTYNSEASPNTVNPAVGQNLCLCPIGTSLHLTDYFYQCLTPEQWECINSGYNRELDTPTIFGYLANISDNLEINLTEETDTLLALAYKITFRIKHAISIANLLNFKVHYTLNGKVVEVNIGQNTTQIYSIKISPAYLNKIQECAFETLSNGAKLWICKINIVPYHPCANLAYMNAFIPIEIGDGGITLASPTITSKFTVTQLDIPCLINKQCFINKDYSTNIFHCANQQCAAERAPNAVYVNGDIVWVRPTLTVYNGGSSSSYTQSPEFARFYFYDSTNKLLSTLNVITQASFGVDGTGTQVLGFPIDISGELANSGALDNNGTVSLTLTFRLDRMRILQDSDQFEITSPESLIIKINFKQTRKVFATIFIAVCTFISAGIFGAVVYCLLKKKKSEIKKPMPEPEPQEVKISVIDPGTSLCSGREEKLQGEETSRI